jgi:hypothetical protein
MNAPVSELDLTDAPSACSEARLRYLRLAVRDGSYRPPVDRVVDALLSGSLLAPPHEPPGAVALPVGPGQTRSERQR